MPSCVGRKFLYEKQEGYSNWEVRDVSLVPRRIHSSSIPTGRFIAKYSKRDYETFAAMLKRCKPLTTVDNKDPANLAWAAVVAATAELFHEDNPRFDMIKFVTRIHEHEQIAAGSTFLTPERVETV